jgi:hypothetical protein
MYEQDGQIFLVHSCFPDQWQYARSEAENLEQVGMKVRFLLAKFLSKYQISGCMPDFRSEKLYFSCLYLFLDQW